MSSPPAAFDLSVVAPVYDERDNLEPLVDELQRVLAPLDRTFEIILVDDGSTDGSAEVIAALARSRSGVRGLHLAANRGQTAALDAGFKAARGRSIVTLDADLQNDPGDIPRLLEALSGCDAVVGYRALREDRWLRRVSSRIANAVRNRVLNDETIDTGCSMKAFRREALDGLVLYDGMHRFLPVLLRARGSRVIQLPVNHRPRTRGKSKYGVRNRLFRGLRDLYAVQWMLRRRLDYEVKHDEP